MSIANDGGAPMPTPPSSASPPSASLRFSKLGWLDFGSDHTECINLPLPFRVATTPSRARALRKAFAPTPACGARALIHADSTAPAIKVWRSQSVALCCACVVGFIRAFSPRSQRSRPIRRGCPGRWRLVLRHERHRGDCQGQARRWCSWRGLGRSKARAPLLQRRQIAANVGGA